MVIQLPWNAGNPFHFPPPIAFVDTLRGYLHRAVFGTKVTRGFIASLKSLRGWKIRKRRRWNLRLFKIQNGRVQVFELKEPFIVSGEKWKITNGIFLFSFSSSFISCLWIAYEREERKQERIFGERWQVFDKVSKEKFVFKKGERLEILLKLKEESMRQGGHFSLPVVSSENHFHRSSNHQNNRGNSRKGGGKR